MTNTEERINELFEELVPMSGKADTVAGEIVRAISRLGYRNYNDGDHIGVGYGKETCNPAARYLAAKCDKNVEKAVYDAWGIDSDDLYDKAVEELEKAVLNFLSEHPELKEKANTEDMWDYRNDQEDQDDWDEEEDDYYEDEWAEDYFEEDEEEWG